MSWIDIVHVTAVVTYCVGMLAWLAWNLASDDAA